MRAFEFVKIPERQGKPREVGITMVIDKGLGVRGAQDLVEVGGEFVDVVKIGFGTGRLYPEEVLKQKVKIYRDAGIDVMCGGTFLEIALLQNALDEYLRAVREMGMNAVEFSDGTIDLSLEERLRILERIKSAGFKLISEVGKKDPSKDLEPEEMVSLIKADWEAGSWKVLIEARESGKRVGLYDEEGKVREEKMEAVLQGLGGVEGVIFEAPLKEQQVYLIKRFGPQVNLGNVQPVDVLAVETLRRGLRADTLLDLIPR